MVWLPQTASASGCALQFVQTSPIAIGAGGTATVNLAVVDAIPGVCSSASFLISTLSDTSAGTVISPPTGTMNFGDPAVALLIQAPATGGGSVEFQALCNSGCESVSNPNPVFTVNIVTDVYSMAFFSPTSGAGFISGGGSLDLSVLLSRNGMPGNLGPGEGEVCFDLPISQNPMGASLAGGVGPCGISGRRADANVDGVATVTLVGSPNMCAQTLVTATAVGFPSPPSLTFGITGTDVLDIVTVSGDAQQAVAQTPFPLPLVARLQCGTAAPTSLAGLPVRFERINGETAVIDGGAISAIRITDASGLASVGVAATSLPGGTVFRACPDFDIGCDASTTFNLTNLGVADPALIVVGAAQVELAPGSSTTLQAQAINDSLPASSVAVGWSTVSGLATLSMTGTGTDDGGFVQNTVTAPASTGLSVIRAERADFPGVVAEFEVESVVYSMSVATLPVGDAGVPLVFGAGVERQGATTSLVANGVVSFSVVAGPPGASLTALDGGQIVDSRARFELLAADPGVYVVRALYAPPSGLPPVFEDLPIEFTGVASGQLEARFSAPDFQLYSDETSASGLLLTVSNTDTGAAQPGLLTEIRIESGDAAFAGAGGSVLLSTDASGQIRTPSIEVSSSVRDVRIVARHQGTVLGEIVLPVAASSYAMQFLPPNQALAPGATLAVGVAMTRTGSGPAEPFWGAQVGWSAQGGRLQSAQTFTEQDGRTFNRLTVDSAMPVVLAASFDPGGGLVGASIRVELGSQATGLRILSGDGQSALPGLPLPNPIIVESLLGGLPQPGVAVELRSEPPGLAAIDPPVATSDSSGRARFTVRLLENAQPGLVLVASRPDAPEARAPVRVEVGQGPAQRELLALSGGGQFTQPGTEFSEPLVVEARNDGQPAADIAVRFEVNPAGAATVLASDARTGLDGRIEARIRLGAAATGPIEVTAVRSDEPQASARFTLFPAVGGAEQRLEIDSGNQQLGIAGTRAQPLAVRYLVNGEGVAGARVAWQVISGSAVLDAPSTLTDAAGLALQGLRFGSAAGEVRVRASIDSLDVVFVLQSRPAQFEISGGNAQSAAPGQALPDALRVRVLPEPIAGLGVEWRVLSGGGRMDGASSLTDTSGEARMRWTLGPELGRQTAAARLPDGAELVFEAQAVGLGDGQFRIVAGNNQQLVPGVPSEPLVIELLGTSGQPLAGIPLRWSTGRGVLLGDEATSTGQDGRSSIRIRLDLPGESRVRVQVQDTELALEFVVNGAIAQSLGASGRRQSVAQALDASCDALSRLQTLTPMQQDLLDRCREFSDAASSDVPGIGRALDQLPNDVGLSLARAGDESVRGQVQNVDQRLRTLRGERGGAGSNRLQLGLGVSTPSGTLPVAALPGMALAVDGEALEREIGETFERWGAFVTGSIGRGRSRSSGEALRFDYRLGSVTAGVDYRLSDRLVLGAAVGFSRDETEFSAGRGTLESSGTAVSAFASFWLPQSWYVDANLSAGRNSFDLERSLVYSLVDRSGATRRIDQRAWGDTDARLTGGSLTTGRDWQRRSLNIGSYLRAQFSRVDYDPFQERMLTDRPGSGLALSVESPAWNSLEGVFGARGSWVISRDWGVLMPNFMLEYSHEFRDDPSRLNLRFLADPTATVFSQSGAGIDSSHVNLGLGTSILLPGGRSGFVQYERRLFDDRISHWLLSIGGRFEF